MSIYFAVSNDFVRKNKSPEGQLSAYKTVYRTVLIYGCETWP